VIQRSGDVLLHSSSSTVEREYECSLISQDEGGPDDTNTISEITPRDFRFTSTFLAAGWVFVLSANVFLFGTCKVPNTFVAWVRKHAKTSFCRHSVCHHRWLLGLTSGLLPLFASWSKSSLFITKFWCPRRWPEHFFEWYRRNFGARIWQPLQSSNRERIISLDLDLQRMTNLYISSYSSSLQQSVNQLIL
jgi:hypothetical protein